MGRVQAAVVQRRHFKNDLGFLTGDEAWSYRYDPEAKIIIIMYIYHALINALSAHMIHINLNMIFYTHVEHSPTKMLSAVWLFLDEIQTHKGLHVIAMPRSFQAMDTKTTELRQNQISVSVLPLNFHRLAVL